MHALQLFTAEVKTSIVKEASSLRLFVAGLLLSPQTTKDVHWNFAEALRRLTPGLVVLCVDFILRGIYILFVNVTEGIHFLYSGQG